MAISVKGVISGIGDRANDINIIEPSFDAKIYRFIIGKDCVISGLNVVSGQLSAGICLAQGYRGYLPSPFTVDGNYIYGHFILHHDRNIEDEFRIECVETAVSRHDDILHRAGEYWLLLFEKENGRWTDKISRLAAPFIAEQSETTSKVLEGGELGDGVQAVTQKDGDNSPRVATTEFVQNEIRRQINADAFSIYKQQVKPNDGDNPFTLTTSGIITRKAGMCVISPLTVKFENVGYASENLDIINFSTIATIPLGYRPTKDIEFMLYEKNNGPYFCKIEANTGDIKMIRGYANENYLIVGSDGTGEVQIGYETTI